MSTSKRSPQPYVPEPRSGEDLVLLPLDPDEVLVEEKPRRKRAYATLVAVTLVCFAILAVILDGDAASLLPSRTPEPRPENTEPADAIPPTLVSPADIALPDPNSPKEPGRPKPPTSPPREPLAGTSSKAIESPRESERVRGPAAAAAKPADSPSLVELEAPRQRTDTKRQPQRSPERQNPQPTPPPASAKEEVNAVQLRQAKEMIAQLAALISKRDFDTAMNSAILFRERYPDLKESCGTEYRELLKLQRTAAVKLFKLQASSGRRLSYDMGDLDVAVIDHDLMNAYLQAAMPTFAREHFLNAEFGYDRALAAARQHERTTSGGSSATMYVQQITENLGLLYASWADYKPDAGILRKADAAFWDSERLLDFADDPVSAKRRLMIGKALAERVRRRLP